MSENKSMSRAEAELLKSGDAILRRDGRRFIFRSLHHSDSGLIWVELPPTRGMEALDIELFQTPQTSDR